MKKLSEMTDEERYGKVGAEIRRLDPEAYKNRADKSAEANLALLKRLRGKKTPARTASADDFDMSGGEPKLNLPKLGRVDLEEEGRRPKPGSAYRTPGQRYTGTYGETREAMDESGITPEQKETALKVGAGTLAAAVGGPELAALRGAGTEYSSAGFMRGLTLAERERAAAAAEKAAEKVRRLKETAEARSRLSRGAVYKKGGTVSSASKRADGIAQRGKTRGRYI